MAIDPSDNKTAHFAHLPGSDITNEALNDQPLPVRPRRRHCGVSRCVRRTPPHRRPHWERHPRRACASGANSQPSPRSNSRCGSASAAWRVSVTRISLRSVAVERRAIQTGRWRSFPTRNRACGCRTFSPPRRTRRRARQRRGACLDPAARHRDGNVPRAGARRSAWRIRSRTRRRHTERAPGHRRARAGRAIEQLQYSEDRTGRSCASRARGPSGLPVIDQRADVLQLGMVALALILRRSPNGMSFHPAWAMRSCLPAP